MKKTIFFSDIMGTIFGKEKNTDIDYDKFNELLKKIKEQDGADEIVFSLISTDNFDTIRNAENTIKTYIQDTANFGRQYFDKGYYTEDNGNITTTPCSTTGKATCIIDYLDKLLVGGDEISSIYFVDDVEMYHVMLKHLIDKGLADKLHSIMPVNHIGLAEVNDLLEDSLESAKADKKQL